MNRPTGEQKYTWYHASIMLHLIRCGDTFHAFGNWIKPFPHYLLGQPRMISYILSIALSFISSYQYYSGERRHTIQTGFLIGERRGL